MGRWISALAALYFIPAYFGVPGEDPAQWAMYSVMMGFGLCYVIMGGCDGY